MVQAWGETRQMVQLQFFAKIHIVFQDQYIFTLRLATQNLQEKQYRSNTEQTIKIMRSNFLLASKMKILNSS